MTRAALFIAAFLVASASLGGARLARADDDDGLQWSPQFSRFSASQYTLSAALVGGVLATDLWMRSPARPSWSSGILLDDHARSAFSGGSESTRSGASTISDVLAIGLTAYPLVIDAALVAGVGHGNPDAAFQMAMIGVQAYLVAQLATGLTKNLTGRQRPDVDRCVIGSESSCSSRNESFVSGHTSAAFAGAGLICAQHQNLALYGDGPWGAVTCGFSLAAASAVGVLRVVADRHHMSDVLAGAAIGLAAGYLLPNLLNYNFGASRHGSASAAPFADGTNLGLSLQGTW